MTKVLVTGGAGFIGSHFIKLLLSTGNYDVTNLDKLTYAGNLANLREVEANRNYSFVKGDICKPNSVEERMKDVEIIVNFAAETHVDRSILNASPFVETNVQGAYNLLEAARRKDIRIVQISTDEVYGSIEQGAFSEDSPLSPSSPYAASKAGADLLALAFHRTYGLDVVVTRSSNNYGPFQYPEKLIPRMITNALRDRKLPIYGDGKNVRDWLYVQDNCRAIDLVCRKGRKGEIYNIGSNNLMTNIELAQIILTRLGKKGNLIDFVSDRLGHDRRYALDCTKIHGLGWEPATTLEAGLSSTIKWYQENQSWWRPFA